MHIGNPISFLYDGTSVTKKPRLTSLHVEEVKGVSKANNAEAKTWPSHQGVFGSIFPLAEKALSFAWTLISISNCSHAKMLQRKPSHAS